MHTTGVKHKTGSRQEMQFMQQAGNEFIKDASGRQIRNAVHAMACT